MHESIAELKSGALVYLFSANDGNLAGIGGSVFTVLPGKGNWGLLLANGKEIGPKDMASFAVIDSSEDKLVFRWQCACGACDTAEVNVTWQVSEGLLSGKLSYAGFCGDATAEKIVFPIIALASRDDDSLLIPQDLGLIIKNAPASFRLLNGSKRTWHYLGGWTMQFSACLRDGCGIYFDTRDPLGSIKEYSYDFQTEGTAVYSAAYLIPQDKSAPLRCEMPYWSSLGVFKGDWYAAASVYREWAEEQSWARNSAQRSAKGCRKAIDAIALWCWNRGPADDVSFPVEKIREEWGLPLALDWYWWHRNPYDTEYPRYLPPREGSTKFEETVARLKSKGIFVQAYVNGMLWDMDDVSWPEGGHESATIYRDGTVKNTRFNTYLQRRLAYMCGDGEKFKQKILDVALKLKAAGLSGLYLDMIASCCNHPCYNSAHSHAPGGGCYQLEGFREMLHDISIKCGGDFPLSSENCGEFFMSALDAVIMLDPSWERIGWRSEYKDYETVPLFRAVYSNSFRLFGNYALIDGIPPYDDLWPEAGKRKTERDWRSLCPDQFFVEIARTVIWGLQPTVANLRREHLENRKFKEEIEFLKKAANFYYANRRFLLWGQMQPPGKLDSAMAEIKFVKRMVFTKEGKEEILSKLVPAVLHSVWRGKDNQKALTAVNCCSTPQNCVWHDAGRQSIRLSLGPHDFAIVLLN